MTELRHLPTLAERERRYIRRVLQLCAFNVEDAARVLGIGRATAYRKVRELGPLHRAPPAPPMQLICPQCGDWAEAPATDELGRLTWHCRGGCNPSTPTDRAAARWRAQRGLTTLSVTVDGEPESPAPPRQDGSQARPPARSTRASTAPAAALGGRQAPRQPGGRP